QVLDFSCGAASIATVLTFYYNDITSEGEVLSILEGLPGLVDWKQKVADGFSFSDLIYASDKLGYAAQGAELPLEELFNVEGPVIVHFDKKTFQHFVVLRRITKDAAYVSDPIVGDKILTYDQFASYYTGKALAIWKPGVDLPRNSRLQAVKDGLSVSDVVGASRFQYSPQVYPIF
ncbi:MAG: cysteine peptidase family C39 domain-containing protein, partial [Rhizobiaceae bacterium]|nr:cysteine peptidase family C39 domain-containing protein [Rhizobiaceae bacterium]